MSRETAPLTAHSFDDWGGRSWRVWWSPNIAPSASAGSAVVRPPGVWFESIATGRQKFLFHPGLSPAALERMPVAWLQEWLEKADTPDDRA